MKNKVAVVTGAFGALGSAVARKFAAEGATVVLVDAAPSTPRALEDEFASPHLLLTGINLVDLDQACHCMDECASRCGGIDVLVNVAGGFSWQTLADGDIDAWDRLFDINLRTAVVATKAALPHLRRRGAGRIVNIGAGAAARAPAGMGAYAASKAGVERLTESLAAELRDEGITVNAILPGTIDTPRNRADMPDADFSRWVPPEKIAEVIAFLASDAASAVTGAAIRVTGRG
jgi:NAD(P)-dependent dehydrogenase (short-subunit alcohol dehydrogenase family)